ncbi:Phosphatidylinositol-3,4,5-trisphosphate 3-phosphatase [Acanthamoeba castellanii str. Neff]|uniref:Phosphatidylinositol-3,4,5-trisphosphate 3-phosphatase n=1 Tax=Acanthamoeba castellanii (strain ATCC 30010 / Neff) TaxID=1257118 RepID=L8GZ86_ACACF|nr:Phosphatidylinositol-3,4,5-trisphosphate 3-phosphatase [Acanthamoeba castellanii str. Neff]ELR18315.1 Phosphatidylinositol-3,4,5-trisphosphate 3-phosphatase [Acanthamoeba castellanii str. Neff]
MNLKKKVRVAVSKDRIRFNDKKHNLDLSYITNNLIAMAFPATGIEATYRNDIDEVSRMLHTYHKNNYMIWNLRIPRTLRSGRLYDYSKFNHQVLNFGFPDHHSPPLDLLFQIIVSMDNWLSASPEHVAVIHCVGGKGRTGTVISCYLIFTGYFADPQEALLHFAYMRSMKERGVTQTSQKRYVTYFQNILRNTVRPHPKVLRIRRVESSSIIWDVDCMVKGDVLIKFYHLKENKEKVLDKTKEGSKKKFEQSMFRFSFHTAFVELEQGGLILKKGDLDIYHKPKRFRDSIERDEFGVIVIMEEVEEHMAQLYGEEDAAITATYEQFFQKITSERIRSRHESLLVVNDEDQEESNADTDAETDEELEEDNDSDGDDDESSSCGQGDLERSTSSDAVPESVPKTGGSEVVRQREKEKEKEKKKNEAASSKSEVEATGTEAKERKKSEGDEGSTEKGDGSAEEKAKGAVEEKEEKGAPSTRPPEKALKKKGSMRAIRKKLSKLKKASDGSGSSIRRRKKDTKPTPSDDEQEASDKSEIKTGDVRAKSERTPSDKDANGANGETQGGRVSSALASSLSADLSASGKKHRRPVTVYAKARHSEDSSNGNTGVNIGRRDGTTDQQLSGTTLPKGSEGALGDAKGLKPEAVGSAGAGAAADNDNDDEDAEAMAKAAAKSRLRSTSLKDVLAGGKSERRPAGATHLLLGSARGSTPQKPLPPTPAALGVVVTAEENGGKTDVDVEGAVTDDRPPSPLPSPPSSPIFSPGSRSPMWGADGGAARRSAGASLSSHRCSVATPSSLGRPHEG